MMGPRLTKAFDFSLLAILAILLVSYCFRDGPSPCDGAMHLSKIAIMLENLGKSGSFPRWNPYWYFGIPMWRIYSPLSYYMMSAIGWMSNLTLLEIVKLWGYLVFCTSAVSTYLLAQELGLKRVGCLSSGFLFLTSFNLITYWGIGSYPNITGIAFSPLAISLFIRAARSRTLPSILAAGLTFSAVLLTYFMCAIMTIVFVAAISLAMTLREPSLLLVPRGPQQPPRYTLALPKTLFLTILIAAGLSMWWALPFLTTYLSAPAILGESGYGVPGPLIDQLVSLVGIHMNIDSPGLGHFLLAVIGCLVVFVKRRKWNLDPAICFIAAFILCLSPWLGMPTGPLFWWRFTLYFSLFASVCGGIALDSIRDFYQNLWDQSSSESLTRLSSGRVLPACTTVLILAVAVYPVMSSTQIVFQGLDMSGKPEYIHFLEAHGNLGDRIAIDGGYDLNVYADVPQSGGGNVYYMYMIDQFAYTFWYHVMHQKDSRFLPYFARSYNVRWFRGVEVAGVEEVHPEIYEVEGFDSSLTEIVRREMVVALFVGDYKEYMNFFSSIAIANPSDIIPVYGGTTLDSFELQTLRRFDVVYLQGLRYNTEESQRRVSILLSDYVEEGGGLVLDTGDPLYGESTGVPEPFPIGSTNTYEESHLNLTQATRHAITENVDFTRFFSRRAYATSFAVSVREGAVCLIRDEDRPAAILWPWGAGRALWTGLRLPYLTMICDEEEVAELLVNMLRFAASPGSETVGDSGGYVRAEFPSLDEVAVEVENASSDDALWLKMTYYPGWTAEIVGVKAAQCRIFQAGPGMMMVFPEKEGDFRVKFFFAKEIDVQIGEAVSMASVAVILILASFCCIRRIWVIPRSWAKTRHTGSGMSDLRK